MHKKSEQALSLRNRLLGAHIVFPREALTLELKDPGTGEVVELEVEVKAPTLAARGIINKAAGVSAGAEVPNLTHLQVGYIIECVVVPGTEERLFDAADADSITARATGDWPDKAWAVIQRVLAKAGDARGKSETEGASSASSSS